MNAAPILTEREYGHGGAYGVEEICTLDGSMMGASNQSTRGSHSVLLRYISQYVEVYASHVCAMSTVIPRLGSSAGQNNMPAIFSILIWCAMHCSMKRKVLQWIPSTQTFSDPVRYDY